MASEPDGEDLIAEAYADLNHYGSQITAADAPYNPAALAVVNAANTIRDAHNTLALLVGQLAVDVSDQSKRAREAEAAVQQVLEFAERQYVSALNAVLASSTENADVYRWRGHAEAWRQAAEQCCRAANMTVPAYRSNDWRTTRGVYTPEQIARWNQGPAGQPAGLAGEDADAATSAHQPADPARRGWYEVVYHGPDETSPAELDWTAEDETVYAHTEAAGFPVEYYEVPPPFTFPVSQFMAGFNEARRQQAQPTEDGAQ